MRLPAPPFAIPRVARGMAPSGARSAGMFHVKPRPRLMNAPTAWRKSCRLGDRDSRCRRRSRWRAPRDCVWSVLGRYRRGPAHHAGCCGPFRGRARCGGGGCDPRSHRHHRGDVSRETCSRPPPIGTASREGSSISDHDSWCSRRSRGGTHPGWWARWVVGCRRPAHRAGRELRGGRARCMAAGREASLALPPPSAMFHVKHGPVKGHRWARSRDGPLSCRARRRNRTSRPATGPQRSARRAPHAVAP